MIKSINDKFEVNNYPYGSLKCTAFFSVEFSKTKGFRHIFQTINPKTGRINNPKKGNYHDIAFIVNENGFISQKSFGLNGTKDLNKAAKFMSENFELFTSEQIHFIYLKFITMFKIDMISAVQYCGSNLESLKPLYEAAIKTAVKGLNEKTNSFNMLILNEDAIKETHVENYNPFRTITQEIC